MGVVTCVVAYRYFCRSKPVFNHLISNCEYLSPACGAQPPCGRLLALPPDRAANTPRTPNGIPCTPDGIPCTPDGIPYAPDGIPRTSVTYLL